MCFCCSEVSPNSSQDALGLQGTHPLHAVPVSDLQLLLGSLEAAVLLVVGGSLEVDVHIVSGLRSRRHGCRNKTNKKQRKMNGATKMSEERNETKEETDGSRTTDSRINLTVFCLSSSSARVSAANTSQLSSFGSFVIEDPPNAPPQTEAPPQEANSATHARQQVPAPKCSLCFLNNKVNLSVSGRELLDLIKARWRIKTRRVPTLLGFCK